jgi:hypothetical protein
MERYEALPRLAVELDGSGTVLGARALHDEENPGPVEFEYVPSQPLRGVVDLLREARELLPHGAYAGWRHDERGELVKRIDAALGGGSAR